MGRKEELNKFDYDWDYTEDTEIDKDNLDLEASSQPTRFMKYAGLSAIATREFQIAWEKVKTTRSELIKEYRENNKKAKNDEVEAHYRTHPDYLEAKDEMIEAEFTKNILDGAVMAMHQKKTAIELNVKLYGQGYWADPRADGAKEIAKDRKSKNVEDKIKKGSRMSRKKRNKEVKSK